ncbi:MAG: GntR family transcriptional regulator [Cellvibrionaceae bacterium]|nr:GntR family transcriptional regulator [Cellvibrionaceae bacterium]
MPESANAHARPKLTERIYQQIKRDIFEFRLLPGDRFSENEVATRLEVSRTPVREALTQLQREGYVTVLFRSGWQINPFDFDQFDQLYDVRIVLELAAVQKLCTMDPPPDLSGLTQFWLVSNEERSGDEQEVCNADEGFHCALIAATGNREMTRIHRDITDRLRIIRRIDFTQPARIAATYDEHSQILRAILARRSERACTLLKAHVEASKAEVRKITLHKIHETRRKQNPDI